MESETNQDKDRSNSKSRLKSFATLAIVIPLIGLTSCAKNYSPNVGNLNIYQPSTLRLQKALPIQTRDGIYTPQTDEIWHSDKRYRILEREIYNAK